MASDRLQGIRLRIAAEALITRRAGYEAENAHRANVGQGVAYGADAFELLASAMEALLCPTPPCEEKGEEERP
jgi:hypothetical protein